MSTFEVFRIGDFEYTDQCGIKRRTKVKSEVRTLTRTSRTKEFCYYDERIPCPVAVDEDGVEYVKAAQTDFGPSNATWRTGDPPVFWYERYSGQLGVKP